jgi:hypothetical protein
MRPPDNDPTLPDIESVADDEEKRVLGNPSVPDEVKSEIAERLRRFRETDAERARAEDAF